MIVRKEEYPNAFATIYENSRIAVDSYDCVIPLGTKVAFNYGGQVRRGILKSVKYKSVLDRGNGVKAMDMILTIIHEDGKTKTKIKNFKGIASIETVADTL